MIVTGRPRGASAGLSMLNAATIPLERQRRVLGKGVGAQQAEFLGRGGEEIDVAVELLALGQAARDLGHHRQPARIVDRAVTDQVFGRRLRADSEMVPVRAK